MIPFEYRALDLLADYETRFVAFPGLWRSQIQDSSNWRIITSFDALLASMSMEATKDMGEHMSDEEFGTKLGEMSERDEKAIKLMSDLGVDSTTSRTVATYFVSRRNLLEDERAWIRFTNLIDDEISIRAC